MACSIYNIFCFKSSFITVVLIISLVPQALGTTDSQCCRKKIYCFECDSRIDPRCGDSFNLTRDTGTLVPCNDFCVKLKHIYDNKYHYLRTCADTLKEIYIKKTEVCYTTRSMEKGSLCFCEQDLCNTAPNPTAFNSVLIYAQIFFIIDRL
jgi:hypothetical protein